MKRQLSARPVGWGAFHCMKGVIVLIIFFCVMLKDVDARYKLGSLYFYHVAKKIAICFECAFSLFPSASPSGLCFLQDVIKWVFSELVVSSCELPIWCIRLLPGFGSTLASLTGFPFACPVPLQVVLKCKMEAFWKVLADGRSCLCV